MKNTDGGYVVVTTIAHEESGESVQSEFPVFGNKPQEIGSSISYARRYNIQAMLDIPVEDDDGNKSNDAPRTKAVTQNTQKKALSSKTDACPACSTQAEPSDIKHGEKDGRKWHKASCECGEDFWIPDSFISTI